MVLSVLLILAGVWVGLPHLRLVANSGALYLFTGLGLAAFALGYVPIESVIETDEPVRLWRRLTAFLIDLLALFMVLNPLLSALNIFGGVLFGAVLVFSYFWLHGRFGRATLGQYVMGYRVAPIEGANGEPEFAHRTLASFIATCLWPVTIISASQDDAIPGIYHWDRESKTKAVRVMELKG